MATQGPYNPNSTTNDVGGDIGWTNPNNAKVSDNVYSTISLSGGTNLSHNLLCTDFGFNIPSGSTIDGIVVEVERWNDVAGLNAQTADVSAKIIKGGTITGTNNAIAGNWSGTEAYVTYGSSTDLWGASWTTTDINASNFGFALQVQGNGTAGLGRPHVDHVRVTVYYTASGGSSNQGFFF